MKHARLLLTTATLLLLGLNGCTPGAKNPLPPKEKQIYEKPTPQKQRIFEKEMMRVALSTRTNPRYRKLALDTPQKKKWFKDLLYRLWDRQITRERFIREGLQKYPDRKYEFNFIANGFQKGCS